MIYSYFAMVAALLACWSELKKIRQELEKRNRGNH